MAAIQAGRPALFITHDSRTAEMCAFLGLPHIRVDAITDFSTRGLLADFEGGKVRTVVGNRSVTEDVGTEMLIVGPDGKLTVKYSLMDDANEDRKERVANWEKWVKEVEARKGANEKGEFDRDRKN